MTRGVRTLRTFRAVFRNFPMREQYRKVFVFALKSAQSAQPPSSIGADRHDDPLDR